MRKKFLKLSLVTLIIAVCVLAFSYYFFHYVTAEGFTLTWHKEAGKPFIADMLATFGVLFLFSGVMSLLIAFIFCDRDK